MKNPSAVALGRRRMKSMNPLERAQHQMDAANARWSKVSEEERAAQGQRLADARAAARQARAAAPKKRTK